MTKTLKVLAAIVGGALFTSAPQAQEVSALIGGTVITATGADPIPNAVVLIRNGRIEQVGPRSDVKVPKRARVVDVSGKWLTPGLIDTNVHLVLTVLPEFYVKYEGRFEEIALQSAQECLKYGMTTVMDTWGPLQPLLKVRDRINKGEVAGSRVLVAGNIIGMGGPFSQYFMQGWPLNGASLRFGGWVHPEIQARINKEWEDDVGPALFAMTPEETGETLRKYIAKGVDFVKVGISGHGIGPVEPVVFSDAQLQAMRKVVREAKIPFSTHTFSVESLRLAVELDADLLQHPNVMSVGYPIASDAQKAAIRALIKEIKRKGIYAGLMAIPNKEHGKIGREWDFNAHRHQPFLNQIMHERRGQFSEQAFVQGSEALQEWLKEKVDYTLTTDQGLEASDLGPTVWGRLGRAHFERMEALQQNGEKPMDILIAATRNGARSYWRDRDLGTLEAGKIADVLVVDADPLADIANLRKIHHVIKDGRIVDRAALPTVKVLQSDAEATWPN